MVNCSSSFSPFSSSSFFFLFFSVSLQVILFLTLLAAELKKTNNKPKRPSVKTLFGNITSWLFIFFLQHSLYIVVISCSIYRHFLVYYTFCSKVQTPIKFDLLWGWCEMGYWHLYHKASYNPNPHVYLTGIYLLLIFFFLIVFFFLILSFFVQRVSQRHQSHQIRPPVINLLREALQVLHLTN